MRKRIKYRIALLPTLFGIICMVLCFIAYKETSGENVIIFLLFFIS